jgi:dCMP deaminase
MFRKSWDLYWIEIARTVATRATCDRKHIGCVFVKENRIITTGYNGSIPGTEHCDDAGHMMINDHCERTVHAEVNAICQAARMGSPLDGCTVYLTDYPCWNCFKAMASAGVKNIYYESDYRIDPRVEDHARTRGIVIRKIAKEESQDEIATT